MRPTQGEADPVVGEKEKEIKERPRETINWPCTLSLALPHPLQLTMIINSLFPPVWVVFPLHISRVLSNTQHDKLIGLNTAAGWTNPYLVLQDEGWLSRIRDIWAEAMSLSRKRELEEGTGWVVKRSREKEHLVWAPVKMRGNDSFGELQGLWYAWGRVQRKQKLLNGLEQSLKAWLPRFSGAVVEEKDGLSLKEPIISPGMLDVNLHRAKPKCMATVRCTKPVTVTWTGSAWDSKQGHWGFQTARSTGTGPWTKGRVWVDGHKAQCRGPVRRWLTGSRGWVRK